MNRTCRLIPLLALLIPLRLWAQPDSLTLSDVVRLAQTNNPAIQRTMEETQVAQARVEQSRSLERPTVEGSASYTRIDPVPEFNFGGSSLELAPHDNYDLHVGARYTLYDFGKARRQTRLAESRMQSAADAVNLARSTTVFAAVRAFYSLLFLGRTIAVQDQEISALKEHIEVARRRVEAGTAISYDVLATQVKVAAVESQRVDASNSMDKQRAVLRELLGLPSDAAANVKGEMVAGKPDLNKDSLTTIALAQRTEMHLARDAEASAALQLQVAKLSDLPALRGNALYGFKNGYEPNLDAWRGNWAGIAQLQVPIYDGQLRRYQKQEAVAAQRAAEYQRQALERQIRKEVDGTVEDLRAALQRLDISQVRIQQAQDAVSIARARYASGTMTNVDVLDAETALAEAELIREQAIFSFEMAQTALDQALGNVVEEE